MIYLDNSATTFPKPECVYKAVDEAQRTLAVNAGRGTYKSARNAAAVIETARKKIALLTKCSDSRQVVFSPSATVAMNQIIGGLKWNEHMNVYVSPFEHNAVARPLKKMADKYGFKLMFLPFDGKTQKADIEKIRSMFALKNPDVVFVNHMSNVTGLVLPAEDIFEAAKKYNAVTVLDASQSMGLINIDISKMNADFTVFAGHKNLYGHFGIGGFITKGNVQLEIFLSGGTGSDSLNLDMPSDMPVRYEPASHNIIAAAALDACLSWLMGIGIDAMYKRKKELTDYAVHGLSTLKNIKLYVPEEIAKHISVISITHSEYSPSELAEILDADFDIAVRSGFHCAPFVHELIGTVDTHGTVRISIGHFNSESDIDVLISALREL